MSYITIDQDKCKKDGLCAAECPLMVIAFDKEAGPSVVDGGGELCIDCGHCVAVCPHGALSQRTMAPQQCPPFKKDLVLGPEQAEHFLRSRRSCRQYKPEPVDRTVLEKLIRIAVHAPSGHNSQPLSWLAISGQEQVKKLAGLVIQWMGVVLEQMPEVAQAFHFDRTVAGWQEGLDGVLRGAPHVLVAHAHREDPFAPAAAVGAVSYLELAATSLGLGTCWAGYLNRAAQVFPPLMQALGLPEDHIAFGSVMAGYPKARYFRLPLRREPKINWL